MFRGALFLAFLMTCDFPEIIEVFDLSPGSEEDSGSKNLKRDPEGLSGGGLSGGGTTPPEAAPPPKN